MEMILFTTGFAVTLAAVLTLERVRNKNIFGDVRQGKSIIIIIPEIGAKSERDGTDK